MDSLPSATQLVRWKSGFDSRSGFKAHAFLKCLEVLLKALTRALDSLLSSSIFLAFLLQAVWANYSISQNRECIGPQILFDLWMGPVNFLQRKTENYMASSLACHYDKSVRDELRVCLTHCQPAQRKNSAAHALLLLHGLKIQKA